MALILRNGGSQSPDRWLKEPRNNQVEHYRKFEAGTTGLSVDKILILYQTYGIDPTYLITGVSSNAMEFNLEYYVANSSKEQRDLFFDRVLAYVSKLIK